MAEIVVVVHFLDPSRAVVRWLSEADYTTSIPASKILNSEGLTHEIRRFSPRYKSISKIEDANDAGWTQDGLEGLESHPNDNGTFDRQEMARKHKAQKIVGDEAEVALLDCVRDETLSALEHADSQRGSRRPESPPLTVPRRIHPVISP